MEEFAYLTSPSLSPGHPRPRTLRDVLRVVHSTSMLLQWHTKDTGNSAKRTGGMLQTNKHAPLTQRSWSGLSTVLALLVFFLLCLFWGEFEWLFFLLFIAPVCADRFPFVSVSFLLLSQSLRSCALDAADSCCFQLPGLIF